MIDSERIEFINLVLQGDKKIVSTVGIYPNGDRVYNGVDIEDLVLHMNYNLQARPGRALFIEAVCFHKGSLTEDQTVSIENELKEKDIQMFVITRPYR